MNNKNNLPYIIILIVGLLGLTFLGFKILKKTDKDSQVAGQEAFVDPGSSNTRPNGRSWGGPSGGQNGGNRPNFKPLHGNVTSVGSDKIIMKADDGSTKNISVSSDTRISKSGSGQRQTLTIADVKTGDEINVMASDTTGSTITPMMIMIGEFTPPQGRGSYQGQGNPPDTMGSSDTQGI